MDYKFMTFQSLEELSLSLLLLSDDEEFELR